MKAFTDALGRTWEVRINVATIERVKGHLDGLDLRKLVDNNGTPLGELLSDDCRLVQVLYVLCKEQAEKQEVSPESFGGGFYGDTIATAGDAFTEELVSFFRDPRAREMLRKVLTKSKELSSKLATLAMVRAETELAKMDLDSLAEKELRKRLNESPGSVPASSERTPDHLLSASSSR